MLASFFSHSAALTSSGDVFTWRLDSKEDTLRRGATLASSTSELTPINHVVGLRGKSAVVDVACGGALSIMIG